MPGSPRPITANHLPSVRRLSDADISVDGRLICVTEWQADDSNNRDEPALLVVDSADGSITFLPPGPTRTRAGRWSPTGRRLALLGESAGTVQIWLWDAADGTIARLTDEPDGVAGPCSWSPDGRQVVYPYRAPNGADSDRSSAFTVATDIYKADGQQIGERTPVTGLRICSTVDGSSRALTSPAGRDSACIWSPDGSHVGFLSDREAARSWSAGQALWVAGVADGSLRRLTGGVGLVEAPVWSPDSRSIAFIGNSNRHDHAANQEIRLVSVEDGEQRSLTAGLDATIGVCVQSDDPRGYGDARLAWLGDRGILCSFPQGGAVRLGWLRENVEAPQTQQLDSVVAGDRVVLSFAVAAATGQMAFVASDPTTPGELFLCNVDGSIERRLTGRNDGWLDDVDLATTTHLSVRVDDGVEIDAWIVAPPVEPTGPLPLLLTVHGGPHWPAGWRFSFESQRLAALGYLVCVCNPRGSQGYGESFSRAIVGAWGARDHLDVMDVARYLSARPDVDGSRMGLLGVSYGGYMTCWAIAHSSLFAAAVAENPVTDLPSYALTTADGGAFIAEDLGCLPWENPDLYRELSPLTHAADIRTPLLLVHGELDHNCPINQSEQMYTALRRHGRDVTFLRIPDEGHGMVLDGTVAHRQQRWRALDKFLSAHVKA